MTSSQQAGLAIALAAILVQAPRLVLALLAADRLDVAPAAERALLVLAGLGTALVLTGGNLYLAHTVARVQRWRRTLAATWVAIFAASGGMVLTLVVSGLSARPVPDVLQAAKLEWPWAVLASVAHELTAAGCVLASAAWAATTPAGLDLAAAEQSVARMEPPVACRAGCGRSFASKQAEIAHLRHCPSWQASAQAAQPSAALPSTPG